MATMRDIFTAHGQVQSSGSAILDNLLKRRRADEETLRKQREEEFKAKQRPFLLRQEAAMAGKGETELSGMQRTERLAKGLSDTTEAEIQKQKQLKEVAEAEKFGWAGLTDEEKARFPELQSKWEKLARLGQLQNKPPMSPQDFLRLEREGVQDRSLGVRKAEADIGETKARTKRALEPPAPSFIISQTPTGAGVLVNRRTGEETPARLLGKPAPAARLSAQGIKKAKSKMVSIRLAQKQLDTIKEKWADIENTMQAGTGQGFVPTEKGQAFDAAVDAIRSTRRQLMRTPGEGSMSDWEGKLDQLPLPNRGKFESVTKQQIDQFQDLLNILSEGYQEMLGDDQGAGEGEGDQASPGSAPAEDNRAKSFRGKYGY